MLIVLKVYKDLLKDFTFKERTEKVPLHIFLCFLIFLAMDIH